MLAELRHDNNLAKKAKMNGLEEQDICHLERCKMNDKNYLFNLNCFKKGRGLLCKVV